MGQFENLSRMLRLSAGAVHKVVWRPRSGELHPALLQVQTRRGVLILITLYRLVIDEMGDIQKHLAGVHPLAGNLFGNGKEHAMHLDRESTCLGLALPLAAGALPQTGEVLLSDRHVAGRVAGTGVVDENLEMHLSLATKTLNISLEMTLIGSDGAAERIVILKGGAKT